MGRALLIEESGDLRTTMQDYLQARGIETFTAKGVTDAQALISALKPDITTLEVDLQDGDGYGLIAKIHDAGSRCLIVSRLHGVRDRIKGLQLGADDYVGKPVDLEEIYLRSRAIITPEGTMGAELSETELSLLRILSDNIDRVVSKDALFQEIYGRPYTPTTRSLDVGVSRLRAKLKSSGVGVEIRSVRSAGYMLLRDRRS